MTIEDFFNLTCRIYRVDRSGRDSVGGQIATEVTIADNEPCCLSPASLTERQMHGSTGIEVSHKLFLGARLEGSFDETARVRVDHRGRILEFEVKTIKNPQYRNHHLLVMLLETRGAGAER